MNDGTPQGETAPQQPLENDTNPQAPNIQGNASDKSELERKRAEQAEMRANQLENELRKIKEAQEAEKQKELAEREEWKTLYEQRDEELKTLREERDREERNQKLKQENDKVLESYPEAVIDIARETGLVLTAFDDESIAQFKEKLEKIGEKIGATAKVNPNNPRPTAPQNFSREELLAEYRKTGDPTAIDAAIGELSFIKQFKESRQG